VPTQKAVVVWPGVLGIRSVRYTGTSGVTPNAAVLVTLPQPFPPDQYGNLVIGDTVHNPVTLTNCIVQSMRCEGPSPGFTWVLEILDRRHFWSPTYRVVNGMYNQPDPSGMFNRPPPDVQAPLIGNQFRWIPWTVRTIRQMMAFLLDAMGEVNYDLTQVPNVGRPAANWQADSAAQCLQRLCDSVGCRVCLQYDTDTVAICKQGDGADLPSGPA